MPRVDRNRLLAGEFGGDLAGPVVEQAVAVDVDGKRWFTGQLQYLPQHSGTRFLVIEADAQLVVVWCVKQGRDDVVAGIIEPCRGQAAGNGVTDNLDGTLGIERQLAARKLCTKVDRRQVELLHVDIDG